jgi:hypothetical protein
VKALKVRTRVYTPDSDRQVIASKHETHLCKHVGKVILVPKHSVIVVYWESGGKTPSVLGAKLYTDTLKSRLDELKDCRNVIT